MVLMVTKCGRKESIENNDHNGGDGAGNPIIPPVNFANVEDRVYRSGFPQPSNFAFLKTLHLRSIIYLCPEPYPEENLEFLKAHNIRLFQFEIDGTKELSTDVLRNFTTETLKLLIDVRIHPVLIHCKQGKCCFPALYTSWCSTSLALNNAYLNRPNLGRHRTGCVVGSLRKLQNWCLSSVLEEYKLHAGIKSRDTDLEFLETYDVSYLRQSLQTSIYQYHECGSKNEEDCYREKMCHTNLR